jgi:hypothetical protein
LDASLGRKGLGGQVTIPVKKLSSEASKSSTAGTEPTSQAAGKPSSHSLSPQLALSAQGATPKAADGKSLIYPYTPYNEGKMDPQLTGWPLTDAEKEWVAKGEYYRKHGHEVKKHLPEMWFVTPTAARWGNDGQDNQWVAPSV